MEKTLDAGELPCFVPQELKDSLKSNFSELTMLPAVASEAIAVTNDPEAAANELANVIEKDVALATQILSVANCPVFSGGAPISNLHQATVRLGFRKCRNLIISSSTACLMKKMSLNDEWVREVIWQHSFTTAAISSELNQRFGFGFDGEEFTAGLLHDFGRLLLAVAVGEQFPSFDTLDFDESDDLILREEEAIGTNHCSFGAWFAAQAGLPQSVVEVIRSHHSTDPMARHSKLVSLTIAADDLANHLQRNEAASEYDAQSNAGIQQLVQFHGDSLIEQFSEQAEQILDEVRDTASVAL